MSTGSAVGREANAAFPGGAPRVQGEGVAAIRSIGGEGVRFEVGEPVVLTEGTEADLGTTEGTEAGPVTEKTEADLVTGGTAAVDPGTEGTEADPGTEGDTGAVPATGGTAADLETEEIVADPATVCGGTAVDLATGTATGRGSTETGDGGAGLLGDVFSPKDVLVATESNAHRTAVDLLLNDEDLLSRSRRSVLDLL